MTETRSFHYRAGQQPVHCLKLESEKRSVLKIFQHANIQINEKFHCIAPPVLHCHAFSRKKKINTYICIYLYIYKIKCGFCWKANVALGHVWHNTSKCGEKSMKMRISLLPATDYKSSGFYTGNSFRKFIISSCKHISQSMCPCNPLYLPNNVKIWLCVGHFRNKGTSETYFLML